MLKTNVLIIYLKKKRNTHWQHSFLHLNHKIICALKRMLYSFDRFVSICHFLFPQAVNITQMDFFHVSHSANTTSLYLGCFPVSCRDIQVNSMKGNKFCVIIISLALTAHCFLSPQLFLAEMLKDCHAIETLIPVSFHATQVLLLFFVSLFFVKKLNIAVT